MKRLIIALSIAAFAAIGTLPIRAADDKPATEPKAPPTRSLPFRGKIDSVDKQAKTVKVGERVFQITSDTRIMKDGKPATLDDAKAGEEVGGAYREGSDKKLNLVSLRLGARPEAAPKKNEPAK